MSLPFEEKRIVVLDMTRQPAQILTNCLVCNRWTNRLESEGIACPTCSRKWAMNYVKKYVLPY